MKSRTLLSRPYQLFLRRSTSHYSGSSSGSSSSIAPPTSSRCSPRTSCYLVTSRSFSRRSMATSSSTTEQPVPALGEKWKFETSDDFVWNFAYGANINPWKLTSKRGIEPRQQLRGVLKDHRLLFNHKGGMGNIEPAADRQVHGVLIEISSKDMKKLRQMEHQYDARAVSVEVYPEDAAKTKSGSKSINAYAFISQSAFETLEPDLPPPNRYIDLIRKGAKVMNLDKDYVDWLHKIPSNRTQRGQEYWTCHGDQDKIAERKEKQGQPNAFAIMTQKKLEK